MNTKTAAATRLRAALDEAADARAVCLTIDAEARESGASMMRHFEAIHARLKYRLAGRRLASEAIESLPALFGDLDEARHLAKDLLVRTSLDPNTDDLMRRLRALAGER